MNLPDTRGARASILGALRTAAPAAPLPLPDLDPYLAGPYGVGSRGARVDPASLVDRFEAAARGWRADVLRAGVHDWPDALRAALHQRGCKRVAIGAASPLQPGLDAALQGMQVRRFEQPLEQWKGELFDAIDAGVTGAEAGIADTGTLVLRPGPNEPRTLSLVPSVHVAVLKVSTLYAGLPAALRALAPERDMPTNLLLVTGPSKTADIQQTLAFGAHGPKELVIVLVQDASTDAGTLS
jgi:L-lactate dehydrogenase complex protein LldG